MSAPRVAVVGGGLGGLTAAGELARQGHAVTLFEASAQLGGKAQGLTVDGLTLDLGPTLLTLPELIRATFARLSALDLLPPLHELSHHCHYRYAGGETLEVFRDLERTAESAARLAPSEGAGVRSFYAEAEAIHRAAGEPYLEAAFEGLVEFMGRVARRGAKALFQGARLSTLAGLAQRHFRTSQLRSFVGRFATYAGASPYEASSAFALIPHLERSQGVHHVEGGIGALARALEQAVRRSGVVVHRGCQAAWASRGGQFLVGPPGGEQTFDALVVNADPLASLGRGGEPLALSGHVLLLEVGKRLALPHHTVVFARDYPGEFAALFRGQVPTDATLYLCHPVATDPTMAPAGKSGLFAMVNAPALTSRADEQDWESEGAARRERLRALIEAAMPEARGAKVLAERTPLDLARGLAPGGSIYGFLPHGKLGPFRRPKIRGRVPGLFFSGGGTHPGGGVPLVMLSGRFAAELAGVHLRKGTA